MPTRNTIKPPVRGHLNLRSPGFWLLILELEQNCPFRSVWLPMWVTRNGLGQQVHCCVYILQCRDLAPVTHVETSLFCCRMSQDLASCTLLISLLVIWSQSFRSSSSDQGQNHLKEPSSAPNVNDAHCFWSGDILFSVSFLCPCSFSRLEK